MPELPEEEAQEDDGGLDIFNPLKNLEVKHYISYSNTANDFPA